MTERQEWQPIATAPNDGSFRLYGLHVRSRSLPAGWFEVYYLALDEDGALLETSGDPFGTWTYDDFEVWADAPAPPSNNGEKLDTVTSENKVRT